jgi:hypothetical protein
LIETASPATTFAALLTGAVCLASGMAAMLLPLDGAEAVEELEHSPMLAVSAAFAAIAVGAFVILLHRSWADPLAILVSAIGWAIFLEGLVLLGLPRLYVRIARPILRRPRNWGLFALALGAFLIAAGLTARAAPLN